MTIDWGLQMKTYNRENNTKYKTLKDMLQNCYNKNGKSIHRMADDLLVSHKSISDKMHKYEIKLQKRFGSPEVTAKDMILEKFTPEKTAVMKSREIAEAIGKSQFAAIYALKQLGWPWRWGKNQFTRHYRQKAKAPQSAAAFPIR